MLRSLFWIGVIVGCFAFGILICSAVFNIGWKLMFDDILLSSVFFEMLFKIVLVGMGWSLVVFCVGLLVEFIRQKREGWHV